MPRIADYSIVIGKEAPFSVRNAAAFLQGQIKLICGKTPPILYDIEPMRELEIVLGPTVRECADGLCFERAYERRYEYEMRSVGNKLYMTGLGAAPEEQPYTSAQKMWDDGQCGTLYAAYRFTEEILSHDFLNAAYLPYVERPEAEMPLPMHCSYTTPALSEQLPRPMDGTALYAIPAASYLAFGMTCLVFKSRNGELVLLDGGHDEDAEHVIRCLEHISGGKKPVIAAWLISHLHCDHYGMYTRIYNDPALRERITVREVYAHLLTPEEYRGLRDAIAEDFAAREMLLGCHAIGADYHQVQVGDRITVGELCFSVLRTPDPASVGPKQMNMNDTSVVYRLDCEGQRVLLPGDGEWIATRDLCALPDDELKCDAVQVSHHGVGNLSLDLYKRIGARHYIWQCANRFYYSDEGEGLNSKNLGVIRTRMYISEVGGAQTHYRDTSGLISLALPLA